MIIDGEVIEIPLHLLRLYQDLPSRIAAHRLVEQPLQKEGIEKFEVRDNKVPFLTVEKEEAVYFARPEVPDETLVDDTRRAAYSIVSLAFKEANRWRVNDGNNVISVSIAEHDFLAKVDNNQIAFAKGDILICDVRVTQKQTESGLKTGYTVERVVDPRPAARQLPLGLESPAPTGLPAASPPTPTPRDTPQKS